MRDKRDRQKKKFIETLEAQSTVLHAAKAAGISRWTAYRWRKEDPAFDSRWDQALENAVDVVENSLSKGSERRHYLYDLLPQGPPSDLSRQIEHRHRTGTRGNRREDRAVRRES
jgi:hypothetical protein